MAKAKPAKSKKISKPAAKAKPKAKPAAKAKTAPKSKAKPAKKAVAKSKPVKKATKAKPAAKKPVAKAKPVAKTKPATSTVKSNGKAVTSIKTVTKENPVAKAKTTPVIKTKPVISPAATKAKGKTGGNVVDENVRYSDEELEEFRELIQKKLDKAKKELEILTDAFSHKDGNNTDDTSPTFKLMEDGAEITSKEEIGQLAARQKKFIENLEQAMIRIQNKTYGICRVTGKLIPKERLRAVPHATLSMEAKMAQNSSKD